MKYTNLFMVRSDTFGFDIVIEGLDEDLTSAYFSCRKDYNTTPVTYVFQKSLGDGITKVDTGETNSRQYHIQTDPSDTQNVELGDYYYDVEITAKGEVFTPLRGTFQIGYDVTRPSGGSV